MLIIFAMSHWLDTRAVGKTMLAEAMLLDTGAIKRMGTIEEGNTISDYHPT